ncbi:hypothetical protein OSB04_023128 [Centaurea solstitialis]|uniref:Uncharacterized protein n=1 Tax=Centaurea solstitialis TaxID=347529 RepID=A0AA38SWW5_9ASTR|nr:hypothetical protein OSB04_023128 [Centaurea solstitialis]
MVTVEMATVRGYSGDETDAAATVGGYGGGKLMRRRQFMATDETDAELDVDLGKGKGVVFLSRHFQKSPERSCKNRAKAKMAESKRTVKLFCPSLSKAMQLVADEGQRIDLGQIARSFGLEPATLRLNGHFISRGVDLIASSVTWKSLISFFSSRGLSTGVSGSGALVMDGKLSKSGSKRTNDLANGIPSMSDRGYDNIDRKPPLEDSNSFKKTKFKDSDVDKGSCSHFISNVLKRKQEDATSSLKRLKMDESGSQYACSETVSKTRLPCSFLSVNMKRTREDEIVLPASCKKIR